MTDIFGNNSGSNVFDQSLNTTDSVEFASVTLTDPIINNSQAATKLYVDTNSGGGGNMTYTGITPATNYIYKALASDGHDAIASSITDTGTTVTVASGVTVVCETLQPNVIKCSDINTVALNGSMSIGNSLTGNIYIGRPTKILTVYSDSLTANKVTINGATNVQYLMGDGSLLEQSAQNGNANFYLYDNTNGLSVPPPVDGHVSYNASTLAATTLVYISHLTRDNIDIDVYFTLITSLDDLYIQDQATSINFAKFNITGTPTLSPNNFITIPVAQVDFGGNGNSSFGVNHNILVSFFSNLQEVNTRLTTLETKTQNQTAVLDNTTFTGAITTNLLYSDTITPVELFMNAFEINTNAPFNCDYIGSSGNITAIGDITGASFKLPLGFSYDFLKGDGSVDTTAYLPIGTSSIVAGYAFNPVQNGTNLPTSGTKSYYFTVLLNQATIISGFTLYLDNGSDNFRMGIFRGNLTNSGPSITLCGQSSGGPLNATTIMNRVAITAVSGQNLNFNSGEYITIAFHSQGSTNVFVASPVAVGISQELAWNSNTNYAAAGFPATLTSPSILGAIQIRPCFELY
jgi:hypothetical protein